MKRNNSVSQSFYMIAIAAMFLAGFLLLVVFGASSYKKTVDLQDDNYHRREVLSYLSTSLTSNQATQIMVRKDNGRDILIICDGDTGYANRIYVHDGKLVEDYGKIEAELNPEHANVITENSRFEISHVDDLLVILTDEGYVKASVKYDGGLENE